MEKRTASYGRKQKVFWSTGRGFWKHTIHQIVTYANEERVQAAELEHLSEFRLGSTWLIVTIIPKRFMDSTSF